MVIGSKKAINLRINSFAPSVYVSKSLTNRNLGLYRILRELGHAIVCGDEEGLVYFSAEDYLRSKVGLEAFQYAEALLAWGPENAKNWKSYAGYHGVPIYETGNPRIDLLRPELRPYFAEEARTLRERFGSFILINTNFSRLNHYYPEQSWQLRTLERAHRDPGAVSEFDAGLAAHRQKLFDAFRRAVGVLAKVFPEAAVVVRPHPSEHHRPWREAGAGRANVHVLHEGNVVPWLLAAGAVIHNGCTTGLERHVLGRPAIAYQPVTIERFEKHLPNRLSLQAFDEETLLGLVAQSLANRLAFEAEGAASRRKLLEQHLSGVDGAFAAERIVRVLGEFATGREAVGTNTRARLRGRFGASARRWRKRVEAYLPGHRNNRRYLRRMFPGLSATAMQERVARFSRLLGRFQGLRVRPLAPDVFRVEAP